MTRGLEVRRVQIHDFDWFRTAHRAVYCVVSVTERMRYTEKPGRSLRGWKPADGWKTAASEALANWSDWTGLAPKLLDVAVENREQETSEWTVTELELQALIMTRKRDIL